MASEGPTFQVNSYILGRLAMWAGRFEYASRMFAAQISLGTPTSTLGNLENVADGETARYDPTFAIYEAAKEYLAAIEETTLEFDQPRTAYAKRGVDVKALLREPIALGSDHIEGAIWRVGSTTFEMRAFVVDFDWEKTLYRNIETVARKCGWQNPEPPEQRRPRSDKARLPPFSNHGRSWVARQDPYISVNVASIGLISAMGTWCRVPADGDDVRREFDLVLRQIETGE